MMMTMMSLLSSPMMIDMIATRAPLKFLIILAFISMMIPAVVVQGSSLSSLSSSSIATVTGLNHEPPPLLLNCNPCIDRPSYRIKAIVHGSSDKLFWNQLHKAAKQAGRDMRIHLEFDLYDTTEHLDSSSYEQRMIMDIIKVATAYVSAQDNNNNNDDDSNNNDNKFDALIVTIPSPALHDAIRTAVKAGIPVFGMNSGYEVAKELGLLGFVSMDEYEGGVKAAETFLELRTASSSSETSNKTNTNTTTTIINALYINHQPGNTALDARYRGFQNGLMLNNGNNNNESQIMIDVTEVRLVKNQTTITTQEILTSMFNDTDTTTTGIGRCPDMILLAGSSTLEATTAALYANGCTLGNSNNNQQHEGGTLVGTFDASRRVYDAIAVGKLAFCISQNQHLQGTIPVILAAMYVSTGQLLPIPNKIASGIYASGPQVITLSGLPGDTLQICEEQGFPVYALGETPNTNLRGEESTCPCIERSQIRIAVVVHGSSHASFWRYVQAASLQGAADAGIDLEFPLEDMELVSKDIVHSRMANRILSYCRAGVDGLIVSIPHATVLPAIRECLSLNIPIMSINSGMDLSENLGLLHHAGQPEKSAGYVAGKYLVEKLGITKAVCVNHHAGLLSLEERCQGLERACHESNNNTCEYLGTVYNPVDSAAGTLAAIENFLEQQQNTATTAAAAKAASSIVVPPSWEGVGLLLLNQRNVNDMLELKQKSRPGLQVGSFGFSDSLYMALDTEGLGGFFGIDQGAYLQGYLPVWLMTLKATTNMKLANQYIETGPSLVIKSPSEAEAFCQATNFPVCPPPVQYDLNQLNHVRPVGYTLAAIVIATAIFFCGWMAWYRQEGIVRRSQPIFLLMICAGAVCMVSAIFPLGIDDGIASLEGASHACMAFPWCIAIGWTIMFAGIFSKIWRINRLMTAAKRFRRTEVKVWHVIAPLVALSIGNALFLSIWTAADPMYYSREEICGSEDHSSVGTCEIGETKVSTAMLALIAVINVIALMLANVEAYRARWVGGALTESKWMFINTVGILQIGIMGIPLVMLLSEDPVASYFLMSILLFLIAESTLLLMFVPKIVRLRTEKNNAINGILDDGASKCSMHSHTPFKKKSKATSFHQDKTKKSSGSLNTMFDFDNNKKDTVPASRVRELEKLLREEKNLDTGPIFKRVQLHDLVPDETIMTKVQTAVLAACGGNMERAQAMTRKLGIDNQAEERHNGTSGASVVSSLHDSEEDEEDEEEP